MDGSNLGLGRRILAVVINVVTVLALLIVLGLIFHEARVGHRTATVDLTGASAILWLALALAYLIIPKLLVGQTFGRWLVGGRTDR